MEDDDSQNGALESREPSVQDLAELCRRLNDLGARYLVVGGFAIRGAGYLRTTMDVDLIIDSTLPNEAKVFEALRSLPDKAVDELDPGDVSKYLVIRVADEIVVDLMKSASGIEYEEASRDVVNNAHMRDDRSGRAAKLPGFGFHSLRLSSFYLTAVPS